MFLSPSDKFWSRIPKISQQIITLVVYVDDIIMSYLFSERDHSYDLMMRVANAYCRLTDALKHVGATLAVGKSKIVSNGKVVADRIPK